MNETEESTNAEGIANSSARLLPEKTVCLSRTASVGYVVLLGRPMATSQDFINWVCGSEILPEFLQLVFLAEGEDILRFASGAIHQTIYFPEAKAFWVCLPDIREQRRIVAFLKEVLPAIHRLRDSAERSRAAANSILEAYLADVFAQRRPDWRDRVLHSICRNVTVGHVGSMSGLYRTAGIPFLRSQNIRPFSVSLQNLVYIDEESHAALRKSSLAPGDVAIVRTGFPGTAAVIPQTLKAANCSDLVIVRPGPEVDPYFLEAFFNSSFGKKLVGGSLVGAAQKHFNVGAAKDVVLHLPPVLEQKRIVASASELRQQVDSLSGTYARKVSAFEELGHSVLRDVLAGRRSIESVHIETAEVL